MSGAMAEQQQHRFPRSDIPVDHTCRICEPPKPHKTALAYRSHAARAHGIYYERDEAATLKLQALKGPGGSASNKEITELRPFMALAIARHDIYGFTWDEIAQDMGKSADYLKRAAASDAGKAYSAEIASIMGDTRGVVKTLMESSVLQMYAHWMFALDAAVQAKDYKAIHTMMKDVGLQPVLQDAQRDDGPRMMTVNLITADGKLTVKQGKTSFEVIGGAGAEAQKLMNAHTHADAQVRDAEYTIED